MSAFHFLNDPKCHADVYEVDNEDDYVKCQVSSAKFGFYTVVALYIVIIIVLIALQQWQTLLPVFIIGGVVLLIAAVNAFWLAEWSARRAHSATAYEIDQTLKSHDGKITRGAAIHIVRQERLAREQVRSNLQAANIHAQSNLQAAKIHAQSNLRAANIRAQA